MLPVSISKILLEHSFAYLFMGCLGPFHSIMAELNGCNRDYTALNIYYLAPKKMFADLYHRVYNIHLQFYQILPSSDIITLHVQ